MFKITAINKTPAQASNLSVAWTVNAKCADPKYFFVGKYSVFSFDNNQCPVYTLNV